ncbi:MAG: polysaccharide biosynthesis protein, partial [Planctomycetes bacterium]|nr:polysaccharide biosynthesis protein [Planctomycetota bacterium]
IDIVFTGIRPGEKLFEELRTDGEDIAPTVHPKVKIWKHREVDWDLIQDVLNELRTLVNCPDRNRIIAAMKRLVPEYNPYDYVPPETPSVKQPEEKPSKEHQHQEVQNP